MPVYVYTYTDIYNYAVFVVEKGAYVLNTYSRISVTQPHEYEFRIPPGQPCI